MHPLSYSVFEMTLSFFFERVSLAALSPRSPGGEGHALIHQVWNKMGLFGMCHFLLSNNLIFGYIFPKGRTSFLQAFGQAGKIRVGSCIFFLYHHHFPKHTNGQNPRQNACNAYCRRRSRSLARSRPKPLRSAFAVKTPPGRCHGGVWNILRWQ